MFIHRRLNRIGLAAAVVAATLMAVSGCSSSSSSTGAAATGGSTSAPSGPPINIVAGIAATPSSTDLLLGIQKGYFSDEGLNVTTQPITTGAGAITQLINGQLQVALGGLSGTITAVSTGIPIVFVSGGVTDKADSAGAQYETLVAPSSGITNFKQRNTLTNGPSGRNEHGAAHRSTSHCQLAG